MKRFYYHFGFALLNVVGFVFNVYCLDYIPRLAAVGMAMNILGFVLSLQRMDES